MSLLYLTDYQGIRERQKEILINGFTPSTWQANTEYSLNTLIKPTSDNGHYYRCIQSGISGDSEPVWTTGFWDEIEDNTVIWREEEPVNILDYYPVDYSYPCIIVGDISIVSEIQIALGNQPASDLSTSLTIITYLKNKTMLEKRKQAFDILGQVQNIMRENRNLNGLNGVLRSVAGVYIINTDVRKVFYEITINWLTKILSKQGV